MSLLSFLAVAAGVVLVLMLALWAVSLALRDASIVDVAWGPLIAVVGVLGAVLLDGWVVRRWLVAGLAVIWAARLAHHIAGRNRGQGEDPRYAAWREEHGEAWALRSLFTVFWLQGAILLVVALPLPVAQAAEAPDRMPLLDGLGVTLWTLGFLFETVSDAQLLRFRRRRTDPDAILTSGLWRYSRHPNYFGEAVLWWGFGAFAMAVPGGGWALVGPLLITVLLVKVSGVAMTEERMEGRPGFAEYVRRTSAFVPLPPREGGS